MNVIGQARVDTAIYGRIPGDPGYIEGKIERGGQFRIHGIKRIGLNSFYELENGKTVSAKDTQIIRDIEFYQDNYTTKKLMKNNLPSVGGEGLTAILGTYDESGLTEAYSGFHFDLQKFAFSAGQIAKHTKAITGGISTIMNGAKVLGGAGAYMSGGGGCFGQTRSTTESARYAEQMANQKVTAAFGLSGNSTVGKLTKGLTVGSLFDGSFLGGVLDNALGMLGDWILKKLSYVVGFDIEAVLSALFDMFGMNWRALFAGDYAAFWASGLLPAFWQSAYTGPNWENYDARNRGSGYGVHFFDVYSSPEGAVGEDLWKFSYAPVTQQMIDYFKYKGCDGEMITRHFGDLAWEQDKSYATATLEPKQDEEEVKVWRTLYDRELSPFADSMQAIREEFNIDIDRNTIVTKFNRFRVPTPDNELCATKGYVFFTRPDLNLNLDIRDSSAGNVQGVARLSPLVNNMLKSHPVLMSYLMGDEAGTDDDFIPVLSHCCTGLDVSDEVLETTEHGNTFTGWKYSYGTSLIKSKTSGTVNVNFTDDDMLSVYKLIKVWCEYINAVYRGEAAPKQSYIDYHQLDYATSIYYFLCKATSENEILFWTKYTGVFPTSIPSGVFSDQLGTVIKRPTYTVPFQFARKDDFSPLNIVEFNNLTDSSNGFEYMPVYNADTLHVNKSFVGPPFVDTNDGSRLFKLKFRPGN